MKVNTILFIFLLSYANVVAFQVEILKIDSKVLGEERELIVSVPIDYKESNRKYEVIYVLDAQERKFFDAVKNTIDFQNYNLVPMIIVGIVSSNRNQDFLPDVNHIETKKSLALTGYGNAEKFQKFILEEVFSEIDKRYRTLPRKLGVGYSNGATFLNYNLINNPNFFDIYFLIDANLSFDKRQLQNSLSNKNLSEEIEGRKFIYACATNQNSEWVNSSKDFYTLLNQKLSGKIIFRKDFFEAESHQTVFQQAIINGLKAYFNYQYFDASNLVDYYKNLEKANIYNYKDTEILALAKAFNDNGLSNEAKVIINAFKNKFTFESVKNSRDLIGLFETGTLFLDLGYKNIAKEYFTTCAEKLEKFKTHMNKQQYEMGKEMLEEKMKYFD